MKKRLSALIITALFVLSSVGCGAAETSTTSASATSAAVETSGTVATEATTEASTTESTTAETTTTEAITTEATTEATTTEATTTEATTTKAAATTTTTTASATTTAAATTTVETTEVQKSDVSLPSSVSKIVIDMGAGWNLGNTLEANSGGAPVETAWGNPKATRELIDAVKAAGFNTVRIPVSYLSKIGDGPDYTIDYAWLDRISEVVGYVIDSGMYAVVNMHGDGYYTVNGGWLLCAEDATAQKEIKAKYEAVWKQIAEKLKKYSDHLIFESMNEEFDGTYGSINAGAYSNINDYNQIFVDTVRSTGGNNKSRWLLVPGWNTDINSTSAVNGFVIPKDSAKNKLMISVHYYDPYNFTLNEGSKVFKWGNNAVFPWKVNWGHEDHVETQFKKLYDEFTSKGYPVIIGEYGAIDKTYVSPDSTEFRRYFMEYIANSAVRYGCVPVYWDNGYNGKNGFALFNRKTYEQIYPTIIEAIIRGATGGSYTIKEPVTTE